MVIVGKVALGGLPKEGHESSTSLHVQLPRLLISNMTRKDFCSIGDVAQPDGVTRYLKIYPCGGDAPSAVHFVQERSKRAARRLWYV